jgi:uncharacterized protein
MELANEFVINKPIAQAWPILTDLERIAPCMPGAQLTEVEGDIYRGNVKIKVGPIGAQFKGQAQFVEKDDANHKASLKAEGRDTKGNGNASAMITASLEVETVDTCRCVVNTDLNITGKVAQFGRGVLPEISKNLINQFASNLNEMISNDIGGAAATIETAPATEAPAAEAAADVAPEAATPAAAAEAAKPAAEPVKPTVRKIDSAPVAPLDAGSILPAWMKIAAPAGVLGLLLMLLFGRRRK